MEKARKIKELKDKLAKYESQLAQAMIGYGGVRHESAVSEIKHNKVMVLRAIIQELKEEIAIAENKKSN